MTTPPDPSAFRPDEGWRSPIPGLSEPFLFEPVAPSPTAPPPPLHRPEPSWSPAVSTSLYWRPVTAPPPDSELPQDLKRCVAPYIWSTDGSLITDEIMLTRRDRHLVGFLEGLRACNVDGAADLLKILEQHETIGVWVGE